MLFRSLCMVVFCLLFPVGLLGGERGLLPEGLGFRISFVMSDTSPFVMEKVRMEMEVVRPEGGGEAKVELRARCYGLERSDYYLSAADLVELEKAFASAVRGEAYRGVCEEMGRETVFESVDTQTGFEVKILRKERFARIWAREVADFKDRLERIQAAKLWYEALLAGKDVRGLGEMSAPRVMFLNMSSVAGSVDGGELALEFQCVKRDGVFGLRCFVVCDERGVELDGVYERVREAGAALEQGKEFAFETKEGASYRYEVRADAEARRVVVVYHPKGKEARGGSFTLGQVKEMRGHEVEALRRAVWFTKNRDLFFEERRLLLNDDFSYELVLRLDGDKGAGMVPAGACVRLKAPRMEGRDRNTRRAGQRRRDPRVRRGWKLSVDFSPRHVEISDEELRVFYKACEEAKAGRVYEGEARSRHGARLPTKTVIESAEVYGAWAVKVHRYGDVLLFSPGDGAEMKRKLEVASSAELWYRGLVGYDVPENVEGWKAPVVGEVQVMVGELQEYHLRFDVMASILPDGKVREEVVLRWMQQAGVRDGVVVPQGMTAALLKSMQGALLSVEAGEEYRDVCRGDSGWEFEVKGDPESGRVTVDTFPGVDDDSKRAGSGYRAYFKPKFFEDMERMRKEAREEAKWVQDELKMIGGE